MAFSTGHLVRKFTWPSAVKTVIKNVAVIGGGMMGSGIAQVAAQTGHQVTMVDVSDKILANSMSSITHSLQRVVKMKFEGDTEKEERFVSETLSRIETETNLSKAAEKADLVIEAIIEDFGAKKMVFSEIDKVAPKHTIFATNSSSLSIRGLGACTKRLDRFAGLHFLNPVPVMRLVEAVRVPGTSDKTFSALLEFLKSIGKRPIQCKDTTGYVVNRLLVPYLMEAIRMFERGDVDFRDVDVAMKLGAGYPMGPFELTDFIGLDTLKVIVEGWHKDMPDDPLMAPSPLLTKLVEEGKLGMKAGKGFYEYTSEGKS